LGRLVGKKIIEKYPHLKEVHGFHMNDFAIVAAASLAHDIGTAFGHSGEKLLSIFPLKRKNTRINCLKTMAGFNRFEGMPMVLRS
jgi:dGTP triphosphohydrolase